MSTHVRRRLARRTLCCAAVAIGASASVAAAYSTTDYFYGAAGVSSLDESAVAANCHIWGLDRTHNITGCLGDNLIVADGHCPAGTANGTPDSYCEVSQDPRDPGDTLRSGGGDNTIFGSGGDDTVYATQGHGTITLGTGHNVVYASSPDAYHIICAGKHDFIYMRPQDTAAHCKHVWVGNGLSKKG